MIEILSFLSHFITRTILALSNIETIPKRCVNVFFQFWRLITNFTFFGTVGFSFLFNMIFLYRYCRMLEEGSFRGRTADLVFMFIYGGFLMTVSFSIIVIVPSKTRVTLIVKIQ